MTEQPSSFGVFNDLGSAPTAEMNGSESPDPAVPFLVQSAIRMDPWK